jgi:hypothetical protein
MQKVCIGLSNAAVYRRDLYPGRDSCGEMVLDSMVSLHKNILCKRRPISFEASSAFDTLTKKNPVTVKTYELTATIEEDPTPKHTSIAWESSTPKYTNIAHTLARRALAARSAAQRSGSRHVGWEGASSACAGETRRQSSAQSRRRS